MRIVVRAFTKDGYHRDVLVMNAEQVLSSDNRVKDPTGSALSGLVGPGGCIVPEEFPEAQYFEIVLENR